MESCFSVADASEGQITGIDNFSFGMVGGQEGGEGRGGGGGGPYIFLRKSVVTEKE